MRLGAELDNRVTLLLSGLDEKLKPQLKVFATSIYNDAYQEGYADGRGDCAEESMEFLEEREEE